MPLQIVNVLITTQNSLVRAKEKTLMTTPDEKTLATLTKLFEEEFGPIGDRQVLYVHAPGRSEISGNHTDHEGGHVIAGSLDVAVDGIAVATDTNKVRVADEGYPTFKITLSTRWMFRSPRRARPRASSRHGLRGRSPGR